MIILLMWGPFLFETGAVAYEELTHEWGGRWKDHEVIGRRPVGQYTGPAKESVKIKGTYFPEHLRGSADMLDAMQTASGEGDVHPLVTGFGDVLGTFRLDKMTQTQSLIIAGGQPLKITYDLDFTYQDDDEGAIFGLWPS